MPNFDETINEQTRLLSDIHRQLDEFNDLDGRWSRQKYATHEWRLKAHLVESAKDIHRLKRTRVTLLRNGPGSRQRNDELLSQDYVTLAGVNFSRDDIPKIDNPSHRSEEYPRVWDEGSSSCATKINHDANENVRYDPAKWIDLRLQAVRDALDLGANIISFGEFDYPPPFDQRSDEAYSRQILQEIDGSRDPVFLFAGSYHSDDNFLGVGRPRHNVGLIYPNEQMLDRQPDDRPFRQFKRSPARKMGEQLWQPRKLDLTFYETILGRIGVLICSDAYDPSIIFEIFRNSEEHSTRRLDFILVPSYNKSQRLISSCKTLSYLANTVVFYVDSCRAGPKKTSFEIFVSGLPIRNWIDFPVDRAKFEELPQEIASTNPHLTVWRISTDFLRAARQFRLKRWSKGLREILGMVTPTS